MVSFRPCRARNVSSPQLSQVRCYLSLSPPPYQRLIIAGQSLPKVSIMVVFSLLCVLFCQAMGLQFKIDPKIVITSIVYPLTFGIKYAFKRRDKAAGFVSRRRVPSIGPASAPANSLWASVDLLQSDFVRLASYVARAAQNECHLVGDPAQVRRPTAGWAPGPGDRGGAPRCGSRSDSTWRHRRASAISGHGDGGAVTCCVTLHGQGDEPETQPRYLPGSSAQAVKRVLLEITNAANLAVARAEDHHTFHKLENYILKCYDTLSRLNELALHSHRAAYDRATQLAEQALEGANGLLEVIQALRGGSLSHTLREMTSCAP